MTDIEQARTILTKWGDGVTPGPWKMHPASIFDDEWDVVVADQRALHGVQPIRSDGPYAEDSGYMYKADATLIVAMTDPALREALDELLQDADGSMWNSPFMRGAQKAIDGHAERIAAVIIAIDQRMNA